MANLLDGVQDLMTDTIIDKVSGMVGLNSSSTSSAIGKFLPAILGGVISKGSSVSGAGDLIDLFTKNKLGDGNIGDILGVLGNDKKSTSWLDMGGDLLGSIFGNKQSSILDLLLGATGLKKAGGSMLMKFLAPVILNKLAGLVTGGNWGASKLSSYLGDQKSSLGNMIPGLSSVLGFADTDFSSGTTTSTSASYSSGSNNSGGGGSIWKWLLPLLIGAGLIWFLTKDGCGNKTTVETTSTEVDSNTDHGTTSAANTDNDETTTVVSNNNGRVDIDYSKYNMVDNGDILNGDGKVVIKGGTYGLDSDGNLIDDDGRILMGVASIPPVMVGKLKTYLGKYAGTVLHADPDGNLVDQLGNVVVAKGDYEERGGFYYDKQGNKLGRIWSRIMSAITNTLDAMKGLFTNMVTKKAGARTDYTLTDIGFEPDGHRIVKFSKAEIEGLAAALKENASGKISVNAYTNDGGGNRKNNELSKMRAQVVHDMLVTLGVPAGQISFNGEGSGDNKVEIKVQ